MDTYEEHFENSCKLRNEHWETIGKLDPLTMVLAWRSFQFKQAVSHLEDQRGCYFALFS